MFYTCSFYYQLQLFCSYCIVDNYICTNNKIEISVCDFKISAEIYVKTAILHYRFEFFSVCLSETLAGIGSETRILMKT